MGNCTCCDTGQNDTCVEKKQEKLKLYLPPFLSLLMLLTGIIVSHSGIIGVQQRPLSFVWYLIAYLLVGIPVLKEATESMLQKNIFSEYTLMSIATLGAFYIGQYPEGVAVMLFYTIGELFQEHAVGKARRNITALIDERPDTATLISGSIRINVPAATVRVGTTIEVKAGERVPLDGELLTDESSAFNTMALTGESVPRDIQQGEEVLAGMITTDRVVKIKVSRPYDQSAMARILEMVQNASTHKAPAELFIRRFARIYTPIITGLAALIVLMPALYSLIEPSFVFIFNDWLYRGLIFLVISCPCALVISIPLGYFGGIGAASRIGILFKGSNYLDAIAKTNAVVFDKTGTLTKGAFEVKEVVVKKGITAEELISTVASAESQSNHPIAQAIVAYAKLQAIAFGEATNVTEAAGYGLKNRVNGKEVLIGNSRLFTQNEIALPADINKTAETIVICAIDRHYAGHIVLADTLKRDAKEAIRKLKALNIDNIIILSGDKQTIVSKLATELGIKNAFGDLLPEDKVKHIERMKATEGNRIAFVGDGINDAPVLALSHTGIAMGGYGSDAAIETADIVIQTDHPSKVATAICIGNETRRIVWQNITLAFGVKIIVLVLGATGVATMWEAVFADVGVALLAILNAMRIQQKHF
ncbi:heavy metal translocating P-type ATPase [uncultured Bacteroides sp.]|uniref:heavy metal translocating P-type ATPase n=1 Tax=uncultured Bacteroides sp. TaxID=162156 RepID=UPI002AA7192B|nr:heavy metal translocating P-type ATPase [uncultured Bacteroides sp.]